MWITTTGGPCTFSPTPLTFAAATTNGSVCDSMQEAQTSAVAGVSTPATVIMRCGTYPAQNLATGTKSGVVNYVAETYDVAQTATQAYSATSCTKIAGLQISVDKVHITGIQSTQDPDATRPELTYQNSGHIDICNSPTGATCTSFTTTDITIDGWHGNYLPRQWCCRC